jgi:hypothetical protein
MTDEKRAADDAERERFEAWMRTGELDLSPALEGDGEFYDDFDVQRAWRGWLARAALSARADGGKGEAGEAYAKGYRAGKAFAQRHAPQAECAPREAQPVCFATLTECPTCKNVIGKCVAAPTPVPAPREAQPEFEQAFKLIYEAYAMPGDKFADDAGYVHFLRGKVTKAFSLMQALRRAAPTPERAQPISDAMMDLVDRLGSEASEVDPRAWKHLLVYAPERADADTAGAQINTTKLREHASKGWVDECLLPKSVVKRIADELDALRQKRADAEKDAALTDVPRSIHDQVCDKYDRLEARFLWLLDYHCITSTVEEIDAAILAAKEKK